MKRLSEVADSIGRRGKRPNRAGVYGLTVYLRRQTAKSGPGLCMVFRLTGWLTSQVGWSGGDRVEVLYDSKTQGASIIKVARGGRALAPTSGGAYIFQIRYYPSEGMPPENLLVGPKQAEVIRGAIVFNFNSGSSHEVGSACQPAHH